MRRASDVEQVWTNAFLYNADDNWVHKAAVAMKAQAEKKMYPMVEAVNARLELAKAPRPAPTPTPPPPPVEEDVKMADQETAPLSSQ